jgi:hypothetical protein
MTKEMVERVTRIINDNFGALKTEDVARKVIEEIMEMIKCSGF